MKIHLKNVVTKKCIDAFVSAAGGYRGNPPETAAERPMVAPCRARLIDADQYSDGRQMV